MLQGVVLLGKDLESLLQATDIGLFGHRNDGLLISMGQNTGLLGVIAIENVVLHGFISSFIFIIVVFSPGIFQGLTDHRIDHGLLLFGEGIEHVGDGLLTLGFLGGVFCHSLIVSFLVLIRMRQRGLLCSGIFGDFFSGGLFIVGLRQLECFTGVDDRLVFCLFAMHHYGVDHGAGISTGQNKANFDHVSMHDLGHMLFQPIGMDGHSIHIAVLNELFGSLTGFGVIESAVSINPFIAMLQKHIAKHFIDVLVLVIPDQRNNLTIAVLKCTRHDRPAVSAMDAILGRPATEIIVFSHFDLFLLYRNLRSR